MRAIDLYSGIGGWSLGLRLAGVEVVASYEWWQPAIDTHNGNHGGALKPVDIRQLKLSDLPEGIDLVVGSPPCTEFSYANRGGRGDLAEGLKDLVKFLEVVDHLRPTFWALENVPRVAEVLRNGFKDPGHTLHRFRHLRPEVHVVDFSYYGTAQARKRCIAGNIPFALLESYTGHLPRQTLGDVVSALARDHAIVDPIWNTSIRGKELTDTEAEAALNREELRMNREAKEFHPIYNNMAFPDPMDEPSRTVTATCTRVSRESIVIADPKAKGAFRRLSIRERASLQGFPITYQFFARSFAEKAKMVGNAIPPTFTYLLAQAAQGIAADELPGFDVIGATLKLPGALSIATPPDREGRTYPASRGFRAALPGLRFKSGMRFDLSNECEDGGVTWKVRFFFGSSKDIREIDLDGGVLRELRRAPLMGDIFAALKADFAKAERELWTTEPALLQAAWTRRANGLGPYEVTDILGGLGEAIHAALEAKMLPEVRNQVSAYVIAVAEQASGEGRLPSRSKLDRYALRVICGLVVGDWFNTLTWHDRRKAAA